MNGIHIIIVSDLKDLLSKVEGFRKRHLSSYYGDTLELINSRDGRLLCNGYCSCDSQTKESTTLISLDDVI